VEFWVVKRRQENSRTRDVCIGLGCIGLGVGAWWWDGFGLLIYIRCELGGLAAAAGVAKKPLKRFDGFLTVCRGV
jgi:hypothetical protein